MQQIHNLRFGQAYYEHATNFFSSALINFLFFKIKLPKMRVQLIYECSFVIHVHKFLPLYAEIVYFVLLNRLQWNWPCSKRAGDWVRTHFFLVRAFNIA